MLCLTLLIEHIKVFPEIVCGSFHVKSTKFQEMQHDLSQMFLKKITQNTSMCTNDTNKILDADHY